MMTNLDSGSSRWSGASLQRSSRDKSARWSAGSVRGTPVVGSSFALTPPRPSPSPERRMLSSTGQLQAAASKVDRASSPFLPVNMSPFRSRTQTGVPADARNSWRTASSPVRYRGSLVTPAGAGSEWKKSPEDHRHDVTQSSLGVWSTDCRRDSSISLRHFRCGAADYRRDALEQRRHIQVLKSNRTLAEFMRLLRQEKEAKATADLFSSPSIIACRRSQRPTTISFGQSRPTTSSAVTSSGAGNGNACHEKKPAWSTTTRCKRNLSAAARRTDDFRLRLDRQR